MADPAPPYKLTLEERPHYLYTHIEADAITEDIARSYLRKIATRCSETECERILIHREIPDTLGDSAQFFIASDFQKMTAGIKTAFVNPYLSNEATLSFAMTVGNNRGGDFALFNNDADAEKWLLTS